MLHAAFSAHCKFLAFATFRWIQEYGIDFLIAEFPCRAVDHNDKFSSACTPCSLSFLLIFSLLPSKIPSAMPFFQNSHPPVICLGALHVLFVPVANIAPASSWNENIIKTGFIAVANALGHEEHLEIIHNIASSLFLPFIITHRTVEKPHSLLFELDRTYWAEQTQSNPIRDALFNHTRRYLCLSRGGERSLPARERLIIFGINHHAAPPLSDISQCSSNPKGRKHLWLFFFFFPRFVSDVNKRINNEWATLTEHIFHLAEMVLMRSPCITFPMAEEPRWERWCSNNVQREPCSGASLT